MASSSTLSPLASVPTVVRSSGVRRRAKQVERAPLQVGPGATIRQERTAASGNRPVRDRALRLLLVDDHPVVRAGIKACLSDEPGISVVGECADGAEVLQHARALRPDVVLMDVSMPELNGLQATTLVRQELPQLRVLIYTIHRESHYLAQIVRSGAHGYVAKDASPAEVVAAVLKVGHGGTHFDAKVAESVLHAEVDTWGRKNNTRASALTPRELEILRLIAEGMSNKEIAAQSSISVRTVETHRENIMAKLGVHSIAGLTRLAVAEGLVSAA